MGRKTQIEIFEGVSHDPKESKIKINQFLEKIVEQGGEVVSVNCPTKSYSQDKWIDDGKDSVALETVNLYDVVVVYREKRRFGFL